MVIAMSTVHILPETDDKCMFIRLTGVVTLEDFERHFKEPAQDMENPKYVNIMVQFDENFIGWSPEAAALSFQYLTDFSARARRLGYVNAPDSRQLMMKMLEPILRHAEIRFFETDQFDEAVRWMRS